MQVNLNANKLNEPPMIWIPNFGGFNPATKNKHTKQSIEYRKACRRKGLRHRSNRKNGRSR